MFTVKASMQAAKLLVQRAATATTSTTRSFAIVAQRDNWEIARNEAIIRSIEEDGAFHNTMAYSLAFAEESTIPNLTQPPNKRMQEQLRISGIQSFGFKRNGHHHVAQTELPEPTKIDNEPLPRTVTEALRLNNRRAVVITEVTKPFNIVQVNKAWEGLCEYTYVESKGKSLGSLLNGPETDPLAVTALMSQLLRGEEAGTLLTNYTKSGRAFQNRLRVGPLLDETTGQLAYYVGILQEIKA